MSDTTLHAAPAQHANATGAANALRLARALLIVLAVALTVLVRGAVYVFVTPPWQHPDEPTHFEHARLAAELGRLPEQSYVSLPLRREIATSMLRHGFWRGIQQPPLDDASLSVVGQSPLGLWTTTQPRLYYALASVWLRPWLGAPVDTQVVALRFLSVLLNLGIVALVWLAARLAFGARRWLVIGSVAFVILQPMHTDVMAAVNNDALLNLFGAGLFALMAWIYHRRWSLASAALAVALVAAALATKATAVILIVALVAGIIFYACRSRRAILAATLAVGVIGLALALGLVAWRLGAPASFEQAMSQAGARAGAYFRIDVNGTLGNLINPEQIGHYGRSAVTVFNSFWGVFGWRHVTLAPAWYVLAALSCAAALLGLVVLVIGRVRRRSQPLALNTPGTRHLLFCLLAVLCAWAIAVARGQADQGMPVNYLSHGRYAFVAMLPFALLFTLGLLEPLPARMRRAGLITYIVALLVFDAVCVWTTLAPYYACCRAG
jgi:hypothetical protein